MPYLVGTDEAGYGPNLGPLVISTSVWHVDGARCDIDLFERLAHVVSPRPSRGACGERLAIADSKKLYKPGQGIALLERGVHAALALSKGRPDSWRGLWHALDADSARQREAAPWNCNYDLPFPLEVDPADLDFLVPVLRDGLDRAGVRLIDLRSVTVFPGPFNELIQRLDNKSTALSHVTLQLVRSAIQPLGEQPITIVCDKHGGRNRYGPVLQRLFPDPLIEVLHESRLRSIYRWGPPPRRVEIRFCQGGESFLPAALASMASKYLREVAMRAFNEFWCGRVDQLRPTAGYPVDARRFKAEIAAEQRRLDIDERLLWRCR